VANFWNLTGGERHEKPIGGAVGDDGLAARSSGPP